MVCLKLFGNVLIQNGGLQRVWISTQNNGYESYFFYDYNLVVIGVSVELRFKIRCFISFANKLILLDTRDFFAYETCVKATYSKPLVIVKQNLQQLVW